MTEQAERFTDILDHAADYQRRLNDEAVANRVVYQGESAEFCDDCDAVIPEQRRLFVPGCRRCVRCQTFHEKR